MNSLLHKASTVLIASSAAFVLVAPMATADGAKWTCTKDGKEVKVAGANAEAKKTACEGKGGTWAEAEAKDKTKGDTASKQSSGGTGSW